MTVLDRMLAPVRNHSDRPEAVVRRIHDIVGQRGVAMPLRLWNGQELGPTDAEFRLVLRHPWSLRAMLSPPNDLTAGEAYIFGEIDVEGSMVAALRAAATVRHGAFNVLQRAELVRCVLALPKAPHRQTSPRAALSGHTHSRERDAEAVRRHYDVGNEFYSLFLDERMVYSCAYFVDGDPEDPGQDPQALDRAQVRKLDLVCRKLRLRPGETFLDIGCGWGALVCHAADHYGVRAVGITLSEPQAALARERAARAGVQDRVDIRVEDYRDAVGSYDAVASVGMFEHVGESNFAVYFSKMHDLTRRGGRFLNHAITTGQRDAVRILAAGPSFIGSYVFPDGELAPAHVAVRHMEQSGFELIDVEQLRPHYARTLRHWLRNLERNAAQVRATSGETIYRIWRAYMAGSVVGFESNDLGVVQVLGAKPGADLPLGRSWMQPTRPSERAG